MRIYRQAICGNHLHLLIQGSSREGLQNFFRVFAGHIAQEIIRTAPVTDAERRRVQGGAPKNNEKPRKGCLKNQRKFLGLLVYTRIVSWGRDFRAVCRYILQNTLEALRLIAYQPRGQKFEKWSGLSSCGAPPGRNI